MQSIIIASKEQHISQIRDLFLEYLNWVHDFFINEFDHSFDVENYVENDIQKIDRFMPPMGRLLLCYYNEQLAGMSALKELAPGTGEIKRMFVRPMYRQKGLGRALLQRLLVEAAQIGYQRLRLDSPPISKESHHLYRSAGFRDIQPYEIEISKEYQKDWVFMEKEFSGIS